MNRIIANGSLFILILWASAAGARGQAPTKSYAQKLVDMSVAAHPNLVVLAMHVTAPGSTDNTIIAANLPELVGKKSDNDDIQVMTTNVPLAAPAKPKGHFEVLVPLRDVSGKSIGALGIVFDSSKGEDKNKFIDTGTKLRDQLQNVIPSIETLFAPFIVTASPTDNLAMHLTMKELARHPDLWVLAFHVTPPGDTANRMIAINDPQYLGHQSEELEEVISKNGNTVLEAMPENHRVETHVPLRTADGRLIGTLATVYLWQNERTDIPDMLIRTIAVRDEMEKEIPSLAALVEPPSHH